MPQAIGLAIIEAASWASSGLGLGTIGSGGSILGASTTSIVGTIALNAVAIGFQIALVGEGRVVIAEGE